MRTSLTTLFAFALIAATGCTDPNGPDGNDPDIVDTNDPTDTGNPGSGFLDVEAGALYEEFSGVLIGDNGDEITIPEFDTYYRMKMMDCDGVAYLTENGEIITYDWANQEWDEDAYPQHDYRFVGLTCSSNGTPYAVGAEGNAFKLDSGQFVEVASLSEVRSGHFDGASYDGSLFMSFSDDDPDVDDLYAVRFNPDTVEFTTFIKHPDLGVCEGVMMDGDNMLCLGYGNEYDDVALRRELVNVETREVITDASSSMGPFPGGSMSSNAVATPTGIMITAYDLDENLQTFCVEANGHDVLVVNDNAEGVVGRHIFR